ncbi:MAG: PQQ-binding-like beta-propeller repeat protein, partial [Candidatus Hydrothermarchaeaceae archaeon]
MDRFPKILILLSVLLICTENPVGAIAEPNLYWSFETGGTVNGVAISGEGNYTVAASSDGYLYLLNKSKKLMWKEQTESPPLKVAISSDGGRIFAGDESIVYLYNKTGHRMWEFSEGESILDLDTTPGGDFVLVGSQSYYVYLLDKDGDLVWKYRTNAPVMSVSISGSGGLITAGSTRGSTYLFNRKGELLWEYISGRSIDGVGILGEQVVSGERYLNFLEDGRRVSSSTKVVCDISSIEMTSDNEFMLVGCEDGKVSFFDSAKKRLWAYEIGRASYDSSISFDGSYMAAGGGKGVYILASPDISIPIVKITGPEEGAVVSGIVKIDASIVESSSYILRVFIDGDFACSRLPCNWNTGAATEGEHEITVEVNDSWGNVGTDKATVNLKHSLLQNITGEITEKQNTLRERINVTLPRGLPPLKKHT